MSDETSKNHAIRIAGFHFGDDASTLILQRGRKWQEEGVHTASFLLCLANGATQNLDEMLARSPSLARDLNDDLGHPDHDGSDIVSLGIGASLARMAAYLNQTDALCWLYQCGSDVTASKASDGWLDGFRRRVPVLMTALQHGKEQMWSLLVEKEGRQLLWRTLWGTQDSSPMIFTLLELDNARLLAHWLELDPRLLDARTSGQASPPHESVLDYCANKSRMESVARVIRSALARRESVAALMELSQAAPGRPQGAGLGHGPG